MARETPPIFVAFDCLLRKSRFPLRRRGVLETLLAHDHEGISLTPFTRDLRKAKAWLAARRLALDGVIAKRLDPPYRPSERAVLKVKAHG